MSLAKHKKSLLIATLALILHVEASGQDGARKPIPFQLGSGATLANDKCVSGLDVAKEVCRGLNTIRLQQGVESVRSDRHLTQVAQAYARELASKGKLTHGNFSERMRRSGVKMPAGENIARGQRTPEAVLQTWRGSPGHYRNMVNPKYNKVGVGFHKGFWVQIFSGAE